MRVAVKFRFQLFAGAAGTVAVGTARLCHEAVNDAMKFQPVVKAGAYQFLNPSHMVRRRVRIHFNYHVAVFQFQQQRVFGVFDFV